MSCSGDFCANVALDPVTHAITFLGSLPEAQGSGERKPAIIHLEKTALSEDTATNFSGLLQELEVIESNDIVCASRNAQSCN